MNLNAGCKNIQIDNNDDDDEEEQIEDEEYEDEDEPDFMDNSGKCWEFGSKIEDEKHLKEWCQNKMGGMIVGKEEKLTRQFHCPNKECQFKAIFMKSCSIVYTRNKHNHGMENVSKQKKRKKNSKPNVGDDYVDLHGKSWSFHAKIGKNVTNGIWLSKFGFSGIYPNQKTLNLYCLKRMANGGTCPFKGIYVKENGCLYIRGKHEH